MRNDHTMSDQRRFSERVGARKRPALVQLDEMSESLRTALWNLVHEAIGAPYDHQYSDPWGKLAKINSIRVLNTPADEVPSGQYEAMDICKNAILVAHWFLAYEVLELIVVNFRDYTRDPIPTDVANRVLEREGSGYRFLSGQLTPIAEKAEKLLLALT